MKKCQGIRLGVVIPSFFTYLIFSSGILYSVNSVATEKELSGLDMIDIFGDFRFRFEQDWDSQDSSAVARQDRARARIRARIGIKITPNDFFEFAARLRSGNEDSQQSPHVTIADFSNNSTGDKDVVFDKWYFKFKQDRLWAWGGRNSLPIWKQNELLWDDDATVIGGAAGVKNYAFGPGEVSVNGGYVLLPDGMTETHGEMGFGQFIYATNMGSVGLTVAGGVLAIADEDTPSTNLLSGNDLRDYTIWVGNFQVKSEVASIPVNLGFDIMYNSEDYSTTDLIGTPTGTTDDDTEGFVFQIRLGKQNKQGDWLIGHSYADIETLAVHASYAQDDWMRWGSATQTRASDFHGHEFRLAYILPWKWKMLARLYSVESNNNPEDGERFRIDFNRKF